MLESIFEVSIPYCWSRFSSRFGSQISLTSVPDPVGLAWYKFFAKESHAGIYFEGSMPNFRSRFSNRFGSTISLTSVSDPVGLAWYKFLARESHAGIYF